MAHQDSKIVKRRRVAGQAVDRLTAEERGIFVRLLAAAALARVLDELERENTDLAAPESEPAA